MDNQKRSWLYTCLYILVLLCGISISAYAFYTYHIQTIDSSRVAMLNQTFQNTDVTNELIFSGHSIRIMTKMLRDTDMIEELRATGKQYTLLYPTDEAFQVTTQPRTTNAKRKFIQDHLIEGSYKQGTLIESPSLKNMVGSNLPVSIENGVWIDGSLILKSDIDMPIGVIHIVNSTISAAQ